MDTESSAGKTCTRTRNSEAPFSQAVVGWCSLVLLLMVIVAVRSVSENHVREIGSPVDPIFIVNINDASANELEALPDVGQALASRIVDYRNANGPFTDVEVLLSIRGFGPKTLSRLAPMLSIGAPKKVDLENRLAQTDK